MHNEQNNKEQTAIVAGSLMGKDRGKIPCLDCVSMTRSNLLQTISFHIWRNTKLLMLTCATTEQGIPLQQLQANKGRQHSRHTEAHVGIGICPRLLLLPLLQPVLDCCQAAVLFTGICKNAGRRLQSLSTPALVVGDLSIAFIGCGISPALFCRTLNRSNMA